MPFISAKRHDFFRYQKVFAAMSLFISSPQKGMGFIIFSGGVRPTAGLRSCWSDTRIWFTGRNAGAYYIWRMQYMYPL